MEHIAFTADKTDNTLGSGRVDAQEPDRVRQSRSTHITRFRGPRRDYSPQEPGIPTVVAVKDLAQDQGVRERVRIDQKALLGLAEPSPTYIFLHPALPHNMNFF
jgi:hypothetical protein